VNINDFNNLPNNKEIYESFLVANNKLKDSSYNNIVSSISGGSDSDIMLDICSKIDTDKKIKYIFFDTGLEYEATKEHLKYLEEKYGITIEVERAKLPIPTCCKQFGQPFLSKQVSQYIQGLQKYKFKWEDEPLSVLLNKYCKSVSIESAIINGKLKRGVAEYEGKYYKGCVSSLKWWCNAWGEKSKFNIDYNKNLKEFMIVNQPNFKISNKCCHYAKKLVAKDYKERNNIDLSLVGVRKAEGGARSSAYKNCFSTNNDYADEYRPIFWYKNETKEVYKSEFNISHSKCYTEYGLKRTGCAGCPYGKEFEIELDVISKYEPKLYKAVNFIFKDSYEYTRKYRDFCKEKNQKN
jgi:3'-phosphoadenosine 5'-phosphosulfate sulfotransferase (PAPS reductase)/FAD synthetase